MKDCKHEDFWPSSLVNHTPGFPVEYSACMRCSADLPMGPAPAPPKREMWLAEQIADLCALWEPRDKRLRMARIDDFVDYAAGMK